MTDLVRKFETGATRSLDAGRYDPEGFLSPLVLERFCEYMNKHRVQPDGSVRSSDNWQKGLPKEVYAKGFWRHFLHFFARHRGWPVSDPGAAANIEEDLCAILFNVMGYLHELRAAAVKAEPAAPLAFNPPGAQEVLNHERQADAAFAARVAGYTEDWSRSDNNG